MRAHPGGVRVATILHELTYDLTPRTLQRRLARLVDEKRLLAEGGKKDRRYHVPANRTVKPSVEDDSAIAGEGDENYVPISKESEILKREIRAPIQHRQPVGYQRSFLDDYRPNVSSYLSKETLQHLLEIGRFSNYQHPAGTYARRIYNRLLIDLSWNSSRLEGNTYSFPDTERLLDLGEVVDGKKAQETQMILNHKDAIELLVEEADEIGFNRYTILNLHALLANNLLADPQAGGRLRQIAVRIDRSVYHPLEVPQLIAECFDQVLDTATAIQHPIERAFFVLVHLSYLQPFEDVNKRVSRLAANIPLILDNLCPVSFIDVPVRTYIDGVLTVYELNRVDLLRDVFIWAYERSCEQYKAVLQSLEEPDLIRLRYRQSIAELIAHVVRKKMDKKAATEHIRQSTLEQVPFEDQTRFVEVVETDLSSLHEGNIARYRLRPVEYEEWRHTWQ